MFLFFCQYPAILTEYAGPIKHFFLNDQEKLREQSGKSRARSGTHAEHGIRFVLLARGRVYLNVAGRDSRVEVAGAGAGAGKGRGCG